MQTVRRDQNPAVPSSRRLWAIASYFNPVRYRRRLANYRVFRERLALPLLTVELAYGPAPELGAGDADILVQIRGGDVMWQKERLLNLAVAALPAECDKVVWLDCDVIFTDDGWPERLERLLDEAPLVQAFDRVHFLTRDWRPGAPIAAATSLSAPSVVRAIHGGDDPAEVFERSLVARPDPRMAGFAWAARRELLERVGLYDASIIGGGDTLMAAASYGCAGALARFIGMQGSRREHYLAWAERWHAAVAGSVGVLEAEISNQWHGSMEDRGYGYRQQTVAGFGYDPSRDIALDDVGAWRWASDKPGLHTFLRDYFASRKEDG